MSTAGHVTGQNAKDMGARAQAEQEARSLTQGELMLFASGQGRLKAMGAVHKVWKVSPNLETVKPLSKSESQIKNSDFPTKRTELDELLKNKLQKPGKASQKQGQ